MAKNKRRAEFMIATERLITEIDRLRDPQTIRYARKAARGLLAGRCFCPAHDRNVHYVLIGKATLLPRCSNCPPLAYVQFRIVDIDDPIWHILNAVDGYWLLHRTRDGVREIHALPSALCDQELVQTIACNVYGQAFELTFHRRDSESGAFIRSVSVGGELVSGLL